MTGPATAPPPHVPRLLVVAAVLSLAILGLDVLAALAPPPLAAAARAALAPTCHQRAERSLAIGSAPLGACARCTGLHAGGLGALLVALPLGSAGLARRRRALGHAAAAACAVLAADVTLGALVPAWDHPALRAVTGLVACTALLAWGASRLPEEDDVLRASPAAVAAGASP